VNEPSSLQTAERSQPERQRRVDRRMVLKLGGGLLLAATAGETGPAAEALRPAALPYEEYASTTRLDWPNSCARGR